MTHAIVAEAEGDVQQGGLAKLKSDEPVLIGGVVLWVLAQLGTVLVGHKIIGTQEWTSLTNTYAPIVITVVIAAISWVIRSVVDSPATANAKNAALAVARTALVQGVLRDADFSKLTGYVTDAINGKNPAITNALSAIGTVTNILNPSPPAASAPILTAPAPVVTPSDTAPVDPAVGGDDRTADVPAAAPAILTATSDPLAAPLTSTTAPAAPVTTNPSSSPVA